MADLARFAGTNVRLEYRLYTVGDDGHLTGFEPLVCANDEEAIAKAQEFGATPPCRALERVEIGKIDAGQSRHPRDPRRLYGAKIRKVGGLFG